MSTTTSKNIKTFVSKIFKRARSGKQDVGEASHIEGFLNPHIQEKYNLNKKNSSVYYADMLLPLTKVCKVRNELCPFSNLHSGKI